MISDTASRLRRSRSSWALGIGLLPVAAAAFDVFAPPEVLHPQAPFSVGSLALGHIDGDNRLDLVVAAGSLKVFLLNSGNGRFGAPQSITSDADNTPAIALADIDGEHGMDVIAGNAGLSAGAGAVNRFYLNTGAPPWFGAGTDLGTEADPTRSGLAVGDLDGVDGQDVVIGNCCGFQGQPNRAYLNSGGSYANPPQTLRSDDTADVVLVDLNGDGRDDHVETALNQVFWALNDGTGQLVFQFDRFFNNGIGGSSLAAGDLDGDGDADLVRGAFAATDRTRVHLFSGGTFDAVGTDLVYDFDVAARDVAVADLDGDGDLDIVENNQQGPDAVYLNDGRGRFDRAAHIINSQPFSPIALGDVDGDGDVDLVASNRLYRNTSNTGLFAVGDANDNGSADFAVLRRNTGNGLNVVHVMDGLDGIGLQSMGFGHEAVRGSAVLEDISGNNKPEIAVLTEDAEGRLLVRIRDSATGAVVNKITYHPDLIASQLLVLPDTNGNGAEELAVIGHEPGSGQVWAQIKDSSTGAPLNRLRFGTAWKYLHALALDDINGNDAPEIALFGLDATHHVRVIIRDTNTREKIIVFRQAPPTDFPLAYAAVPDVDGALTRVAMLSRSASGHVRVFVHNATDGQRVAKLGYNSELEPLDLLVMGDTDGSSGPGEVSPEIAVLGRNASGSVRLQMRDLDTGSKLGDGNALGFFSSHQPVRLLELGNAGSGPASDVALLSISLSGNGVHRVQIKDPITRDPVTRTRLP